MAEYHGVLPLLARNLLAHGRGTPPDVEQTLRAEFAENVRRNLWFASELVRISRGFAARNIVAIPYKGPLLAELAYGDLALRRFSDLDFLISPQDFARARQALADLGYQPSTSLSAVAQRMELKTGYELAFDSAAGKYLVELQWRLLPLFYAIDIRSGDLVRRSATAVLGGQELPSLSPEDLLLVLCLHAAKHLWMRMIWLGDIAETIRSQKIDYEIVWSRAQNLGVTRIVGVSLSLAKNVLESELPEAAVAGKPTDPREEALGREFAARLSRGAGYDLESRDYFWRILGLRERRRDQARYLWRLVWTPGAGDVAAVRLPGKLSPFYGAVRVVRLLRKLG